MITSERLLKNAEKTKKSDYVKYLRYLLRSDQSLLVISPFCKTLKSSITKKMLECQKLLGQRKNILVTGGAGFIGGAVVRRLLRESDATVFNLDKLGYASNLTSIQEHWPNLVSQMEFGTDSNESTLRTQRP